MSNPDLRIHFWQKGVGKPLPNIQKMNSKIDKNIKFGVNFKNLLNFESILWKYYNLMSLFEKKMAVKG